nr:notchless protein homolog [Tanacetum cinerariifolium]
MDSMEEANNNSVMCQLSDPEGNPLGASMYLPQLVGPKELQQMVNKLLDNEEKLPYAFYISDQELVIQLGEYLQKNKVSVEKVVTIVYQPQAVFRIRPVNRCSSTIAGHTEAVLSVVFSPDGQQLASGSGDTTVRLWDLNTQTPMFTCTGISWEPVHLQSPCRRFVTSSKDGDARIWDATMRKTVIVLSGHTLAVTCVKWGGDGFIYTG